jgi:hypothetical protein
MSNYMLLFRISIRHPYYLSGFARELGFFPTPHTRKIMAGAGLILKKEDSGISMFFNQARTDALKLYASDPLEPFCFNFKVYSRDPFFENFTELPFSKKTSILFFESKKASLQANGDYRLTRDEQVFQSDLKEIDSKVIMPMLTRSEKMIRPLCIISIDPNAPKGSLFDSKSYYLEFCARKTFWKYYLLGKYTKENLSILDLDNQIIFIQKENELLPDNNGALVFESDKSIPLTQRPSRHFQLKKIDSKNSRVLVKRLPVASSDQINRRINKDNNKEYVSEIFINP